MSSRTTGFTELSTLKKILPFSPIYLKSHSLWIFGLFVVIGIGACSVGEKDIHHNSEKPKVESKKDSSKDDLVFYSKKIGVLEKNVVNGFVENKSSHITYSNINVLVEFYDENKALLKSSELEINETVQPDKMQKIKLDVDYPEGTDSYKIKLISADNDL